MQAEPTNNDICSASEFAQRISEEMGLGSLPQDFRRDVFRELLKQFWGELPQFSTLKDGPEISVVAKATVGTGVVPIFTHPIDSKLYAVVQRPGTHYRGARYRADENDPYYMIAGGFIDLTITPGVPDLIESNTERAEHPAEGAVRELTEEIVDDKGNPIIKPSPARLHPLDTRTLTFPSGERRLVIGFVLSLNLEEIEKILHHVERIKSDEVYRRACRKHTTNTESGEPEVCQVDIVPLEAMIADNLKLLHPDQRSLFGRISRYASAPHL